MVKNSLAGRHVARFVEQAWGYNMDRKNPYVEIAMQIVGGPHDGRPVKWVKSLTDGSKSTDPNNRGTRDTIADAFRAFGWSGEGDPSRLTAAELSRLVSIEMREVEAPIRGARRRFVEVSFINPLTRVKNELVEEERARVMDRFFGASAGWNANGDAREPEEGDPFDEAEREYHDPVTGEVEQPARSSQPPAAAARA